MIIVHPTSLDATLDATAEAFFYSRPVSTAMREEIATLITSRQAHTRENSGFFIPFTAEIEAQGRLFTGETLRTAFARAHLRLIEAARVLRLLAVENHAAAHSIQTSNQLMQTMCYSSFCPKGECKALTVAYMRYLAVDGEAGKAHTFTNQLSMLAAHRDGKGRWSGFPYLYTLLMLTEVIDPLADQELSYSRQAWDRLRATQGTNNPMTKRQQAIVDRAASRVLERS